MLLKKMILRIDQKGDQDQPIKTIAARNTSALRSLPLLLIRFSCRLA